MKKGGGQMKPFGWLVRLVGVSFLANLLPANATNTIGSTGEKALEPQKARLDILSPARSVLEKLTGRGRKTKTDKLEEEWRRALGLDPLRRLMAGVFRQGWGQLFLDEDTESDAEHIKDCQDILLKVGPEEGLSTDETQYGIELLERHEIIEGILKKDTPLVPTRVMPRTKRGRILFLRHKWIPPSREAELRRLKREYTTHKPLVEAWVRKNIPEEDQPTWLATIEDFCLVGSKVAQVCFEVHAFQSARKAIFVMLDKPKRFPPEAAEVWILRAEKLITLRSLLSRLDFVKEKFAAFVEE